MYPKESRLFIGEVLTEGPAFGILELVSFLCYSLVPLLKCIHDWHSVLCITNKERQLNQKQIYF